MSGRIVRDNLVEETWVKDTLDPKCDFAAREYRKITDTFLKSNDVLLYL